MDRDIRGTIGCNLPRIDEDVVEHLGTPCSMKVGLRLGYNLSVDLRQREGHP